MKNLTLADGLNLISHLKEIYESWYNSLADKTGHHDFVGFVNNSVISNNYNNGSEEDFVFIAEDAMFHLGN